jgi:GH24 family phage-related lysozyme (muramidase)
MHASQKIINFMFSEETMVLHSYSSLEGGFKTIGIGHKFKTQEEQDKYEGVTITEEEAWDIFYKDIYDMEEAVKEMGIPRDFSPTQWEFDGIVSFIFNAGQFHQHTTDMITYVMNKDWVGLRLFFNNYMSYSGLVTRRAAEYEIITTGSSERYV